MPDSKVINDTQRGKTDQNRGLIPDKQKKVGKTLPGYVSTEERSSQARLEVPEHILILAREADRRYKRLLEMIKQRQSQAPQLLAEGRKIGPIKDRSREQELTLRQIEAEYYSLFRKEEGIRFDWLRVVNEIHWMMDAPARAELSQLRNDMMNIVENILSGLSETLPMTPKMKPNPILNFVLGYYSNWATGLASQVIVDFIMPMPTR